MAQRLFDPLGPRWPAPLASGSPITLSGDAVHVWSVGLDPSSSRVRMAFDLLAPLERGRAARFHFEKDRRHYAVCRGVLRMLLGAYLDQEPSRVELDYGPWGKPAVTGAGSGLHFNVSHAGGRALLAFARGRELGVDLELERPVPEMEELAARYLSPAESETLLALPEGERQAAFFRCWTRKEAFLKATGDGLTRALDGFSVSLAPGSPARLEECRDDATATSRFSIQSLETGYGFHAALCVEGSRPRVVRGEWWVSEEGSDERRRARGHHDLQGGPQPRRAVLDLAR